MVPWPRKMAHNFKGLVNQCEEFLLNWPLLYHHYPRQVSTKAIVFKEEPWEAHRGKGVQRVNRSGMGASPDLQKKSISLACVYSEADKDPAPAQDKLILLWAQKTLELNLCKVEEGVGMGRRIYINIYDPLGDPMRSHKFQLPF